MAGWHVLGIICFPTYSLSERRLSASRAGTARANAQASGQAAGTSIWRLHFEQGRDFPSALRYLGQAAESSAKRLGHAEAASYLTRGLSILDRIEVPDKFKLRITVLRHR